MRVFLGILETMFKFSENSNNRKVCFWLIFVSISKFKTQKCLIQFWQETHVPESWNFHSFFFRYRIRNPENFSFIGQDLTILLIASLYKLVFYQHTISKKMLNCDQKSPKNPNFGLKTSLKVPVFLWTRRYFKLDFLKIART